MIYYKKIEINSKKKIKQNFKRKVNTLKGEIRSDIEYRRDRFSNIKNKNDL